MSLPFWCAEVEINVIFIIEKLVLTKHTLDFVADFFININTHDPLRLNSHLFIIIDTILHVKFNRRHLVPDQS